MEKIYAEILKKFPKGPMGNYLKEVKENGGNVMHQEIGIPLTNISQGKYDGLYDTLEDRKLANEFLDRLALGGYL